MKAEEQEVGAFSLTIDRLARPAIFVGGFVLVVVGSPLIMFVVKQLIDPRGPFGDDRLLLAAIAALAMVALIVVATILALRRERQLRATRRPAADARSIVPSGLPDCPYCKSPIDARAPEGTLRCPACETAHHADCYRENQGCTIHGCVRSPRGRVLREPERA